jgi:hypothetical protein
MLMCSNGSSDFKCYNHGQCSSNNICICTSACFVGNYCEINYNAARLPLTGAVMQDIGSGRNVYIVVFVLFGVFGLLNNILALTTFVRERIRVTGCSIYLIMFSVLSIALMINILTYIMTITQYDNAAYQRSACYLIPYISVVMEDGSLLCTVAIAIERALIECCNFRINGSRIRGLLVSFIIILYACGSNIDELFIRRFSRDPEGNQICIYDFDRYPTWRMVDLVFSYLHFIIPCVAHLICTACVLTMIARRKIFIRGTDEKFYRVWLQQLYLHRDFLIPPTCLILCILPHGILGHLLQTCIPYSDKAKLRLHISFVLLLFVPQMLSFVLYVYPNDIYWNEFQHTIIYRTVCCYSYRKRHTLKRKAHGQLLWKERTSSAGTISEASSINGQNESTF